MKGKYLSKINYVYHYLRMYVVGERSSADVDGSDDNRLSCQLQSRKLQGTAMIQSAPIEAQRGR